MGEKERGAMEEGERQTQQSSFGERAARPREAGDQREGGGGAGGGGLPDPAEAAVKSKSNITNNREAAPGGGGDDGEATPGEFERQTPKRDFGERLDSSPKLEGRDRMGAGGNIEDDPGGGAPDTDTPIIKSKSNITNNREAAPGGESNIRGEGGHNDAGEEAGLAIGDQGAVEPEHRPRPK